MKFKFLFCGMFVLIGSSQSTGFRVLGRVNYIGAAALQTHVRYDPVRYCTVKHGTEFQVPPGLKLAEISKVGLPPKADMKKLIEESKKFPPIDFSKYVADYEKDTLYRIDEQSNAEKRQSASKEGSAHSTAGAKEKFSLQGVVPVDFEKADALPELSHILSAVGLVSVDFGDNKYALGTGFAIRANAVLTAAHNIYDVDRLGNALIAKTVRFYSRYDNGSSNLILPVKSYKIPKEWEENHDFSYDFALLCFSDSIFDATLDLASVKPGMHLPIPIRIAGYPDKLYVAGKVLDNHSTSLYANGGYLRGTVHKTRVLQYDVATSAGMSGGPIFVRELPIALGVHTRGGHRCNKGVHYAEHMISYLNKWFAELTDNAAFMDEGKKVIAELARNAQEEDYLMKKLPLLQKYSPTKLKDYISLLLDVYRQDGPSGS